MALSAELELILEQRSAPCHVIMRFRIGLDLLLECCAISRGD